MGHGPFFLQGLWHILPLFSIELFGGILAGFPITLRNEREMDDSMLLQR